MREKSVNVSICHIFEGVKKAQLLCVVPGIPETYLNLSIILGLLKLDEVSFKIAANFKLLNVLLGLSVSSMI